MSRAAHRLASLTLAVASASCGAPKPAAQTVVLGGAKKAVPAAPAMPGVNVPAIKVDTVGYPTSWKKVAIWNVEPKDAVVKDEAGKVVLKIAADKVVSKGVDEASKDPVWQVDFSELKTPGTYVLESAGAKSDPFKIGDDVHQVALIAGLKSFYFQRTRMPLEKPFAVWEGEAYTRKKASHVHDDVGWDLLDYPDKKRKWKVEAGWHDAGNYDMYVPSTAPSAQTLLYAFEWNPDAFDDKSVVIPESGNKIPDILDEAKYGLLWVLSMQEDNGAFRHREAVMETSPELPADEDMTVRWIAGISTAGTAKAVAATAVCARIYEPYDAAFAKRCAEASKKGWAWLKANPKRVITDGRGSEQPLWDDEPENTDTGAQFVAAVEYWKSFRDPAALDKAKSLMGEKELTPNELANGAWANISRWGLCTLAFDGKTPAALKSEAKTRLLAAADTMRAHAESKDGYLNVQTPEQYYWASSSNLMEKTHILAVAARLTGDAKYLQIARDQWHWVLGRNPNGFSMATRVGKGPTRLYHMEWGHHEPPPPGFLVGGPNGQSMPFLAPGAPAKALLWDNPKPLRSGAPAHALWHWQQTDLWDAGFVAEDSWDLGWWTVIEPDIIYSANFVLAAVAVR